MAAQTLQQLPTKVSIKLYRGDDWPIQLRRWSDSTKTTLADLSGYSAELRISDAEGVLLDTLSSASGDIILNDGQVATYNLGIQFLKARVALFTFTTATYDFSLTDTLGMTRTFFKGPITVEADV